MTFLRFAATKPGTDRRLPELRCKTVRFRHIQVPERRGRRARNTRHARLRGPRSTELRTDRCADRHVVRNAMLITYIVVFFDKYTLCFRPRVHPRNSDRFRSIGVLMYVLLTGCSPFGGDTKQETFCNISQCKLDFPEELFQDISEDAIDLMKKLMVKNPRWVVVPRRIVLPFLLYIGARLMIARRSFPFSFRSITTVTSFEKYNQ